MYLFEGNVIITYYPLLAIPKCLKIMFKILHDILFKCLDHPTRSLFCIFLIVLLNGAPSHSHPQRRQPGGFGDRNRQYNRNSLQTFDVPDTIDAYKPEKIPDVPIDLGERSK